MYNYTNAPYKTQEHVLQVLSEEYGDGLGGLSGNDNAGQMSAWYVFAVMGFYPLNPVSGEYALSTPLFDRITIKLSENKTFIIQSDRSSKQAKFISSVKLNSKTFLKSFIRYHDIMKGGKLDIYLADSPARNKR